MITVTVILLGVAGYFAWRHFQKPGKKNIMPANNGSAPGKNNNALLNTNIPNINPGRGNNYKNNGSANASNNSYTNNTSNSNNNNNNNYVNNIGPPPKVKK